MLLPGFIAVAIPPVVGFGLGPAALGGTLGGGLLAWVMTYGTYRGVYAYLFEIAWVPGMWVGAGLALGSAFGMVSSALAIRRHLREV